MLSSIKNWSALHAQNLDAQLEWGSQVWKSAFKSLDYFEDLPAPEAVVAPYWQITPISGMISLDRFFNALSRGVFIVNTDIPSIIPSNTQISLSTTKPSDYYHDIVAQVPCLYDPMYSRLLRTIALAYVSVPPSKRALVYRMYWWLVEHSLIQEREGLVLALGSTLLSNQSCLHHALGPRGVEVEMDGLSILEPIEYRHIQPQYVVIPSLEEAVKLVFEVTSTII